MEDEAVFVRILLQNLPLVNFVATQQCKNEFSLHLLLQNLEVSIILPIFAPSKDKVMEEKRYPTEEESFEGKVSEPIAAPVPDTMSVEGMTEVHDWIDDLDWDKFPSFGPFSDEEAIARIEEAERDLKDPSKWVTSEQMWENLYKKYPWLR